MKKYLSNSNIWGPILSFLLYVVVFTSMWLSSWLSGTKMIQREGYLVMSVLVGFVCSWMFIPRNDDLGFIGSTNVSFNGYLLALVKRNLWFNGACLVFSLMLVSSNGESVFTTTTLIQALLMISGSLVVIGVRIEHYGMVVLFIGTLLVGVLYPSLLYLTAVALICAVLSLNVYKEILLKKDLS